MMGEGAGQPLSVGREAEAAESRFKVAPGASAEEAEAFVRDMDELVEENKAAGGDCCPEEETQ